MLRPLRRFDFPSIAFIFCFVMAASQSASAKDHFLTIGGGSSASNNQVSLEKNVLYLQRFIHDSGFEGMPHEILFSDGLAGAKDLQFFDPDFEPPRANALLAEIFDREQGLTTQYRPHVIPHLWGPSGRQSLGKWFDTIGTKLGEDDRLFIYFTGHGGRGQGKPPTNQTLAMWNEADMPVKEFAALLDKLPAKVRVVLMMVQCFGGGFADVMFTDGDPSKGLSSRNRCGFFATLPTRVAAGCTADVDEENYKEYSTYFWAALYGQTRSGDEIEKPDFDGDGKVSFAEAHAYTLIHSETVDISMKTSDAFLRKYAKGAPLDGGALLNSEDDFDRLVAVANPPDKAVLQQLSKLLQLDGARRVQTARTKFSDIERQRREIDKKKQKLSGERDQIRQSLRSQLERHWPELGNLLNPNALKILAEESPAIVKFIESSPRFDEFEKQGEDVEALEKQAEDLDRTGVKQQRFIRTAETVAMGVNLPKVAKEEIVQRYKLLLEAENGVLNAAK